MLDDLRRYDSYFITRRYFLCIRLGICPGKDETGRVSRTPSNQKPMLHLLVRLPTSGCRTGTYPQYLAYARHSFLWRRTRPDNLYDLRNLGLITTPYCLEQCFQECLLPITLP